jgi:hypothetical protein
VETVVNVMIPHAHDIAGHLHAAAIAHHINHHMFWINPAEMAEQELEMAEQELLEEQGNAPATGHVAEGNLTELELTP